MKKHIRVFVKVEHLFYVFFATCMFCDTVPHTEQDSQNRTASQDSQESHIVLHRIGQPKENCFAGQPGEPHCPAQNRTARTELLRGTARRAALSRTEQDSQNRTASRDSQESRIAKNRTPRTKLISRTGEAQYALHTEQKPNS